MSRAAEPQHRQTYRRTAFAQTPSQALWILNNLKIGMDINGSNVCHCITVFFFRSFVVTDGGSLNLCRADGRETP